jgi:hypothetical protein
MVLPHHYLAPSLHQRHHTAEHVHPRLSHQ